ncbi:UDP-2,3-diacylglucosamine diphosphatase LpxI [soil metagenome]
MLQSSLHSKKATTLKPPADSLYLANGDERLEKLPARIGLIAGEGNFPILLARAAHSEGVEIVTFGVHGLAHDSLSSYSSKFYTLKLSEMSRLLDLAREHDIHHVIMAGRVPQGFLLLKQISFDPRIIRILAGLRNKKSDSLLGAAVDELAKEGIEVLDSTIFLKSLMPEPGLLTLRTPASPEIMKDIEFGYPLAKELGRVDIGQTIAVKDQIVVAVEALEGTDELIKRCHALAGDGIVFVKVAKPRQDMRFDVPVIGITTIKNLVAAKAAALCVTARQSLFFDRPEAIALAEQHGISIIARADVDGEAAIQH